MLRRAAMTMTVVALAAAPALAQSVPEIDLPPSPSGQAAVQVGGRYVATEQGGQRYEGGKWITVEYSRPILRGRTGIFGSGAEYGKTVTGSDTLWRAGANATTRLTTQATLDVGGKAVPPGTYNVLVELKEGAWTLVLTNQPAATSFNADDTVNLYGATNYDPKFDVARVPMRVLSTDVTVEQFTIGFINASATSVSLAMWWDRTMAVAPLGVK